MKTGSIIKYNQSYRMIDILHDRAMKSHFSKSEYDFARGVTKVQELFIRDGSDMIIPKGAFDRIVDSVEVDLDKTFTNEVRDIEIVKDLGELTLREVQVEAIEKLLEVKTGSIQATVGFGKSLLIASIIKSIQGARELPLTSLILVPTTHLLNETGERLEAYGLKVNNYNKTRKLIKGETNIVLPQSLVNDIKNDKTTLDYIDLVLVDEAHKSAADTYFSIIVGCYNAERVYGLSGTLYEKPLHKYDFNTLNFDLKESRLVAMFDNVVHEITYQDMVAKGFLAQMKAVQIEFDLESDTVGDFASSIEILNLDHLDFLSMVQL